MGKPWIVLTHPEFAREYEALPTAVGEALDRAVERLKVEGPLLGRPTVDTLAGSAHPNMKELRVKGSWRFAFAFDPERRAIILCGGDKAGVSTRRFYGRLLATADARFADWQRGDG